jgi:serine/threonine-protein kinase
LSRRATSDPTAPPHFIELRAAMLYALGRQSEALAEALRPAWAQLGPLELAHRAKLAAAYGDFETARKHAEEGLARVAALPDRPLHERFSVLLAELARETGRTADATAVAVDFLRRRDGWQFGREMEDPTVYLTRIAARGGALSDAEVRARRDDWYAAIKPRTPLEEGRAWGLAYVDGIESEEEGREALAALPAAALGPAVAHSYWIDEELGRALWLGGKRDEALPYLERSWKRCDVFLGLPAKMRTNLFFGRVLEERGARARACEVYRDIVSRWGQARPRSVTAEEARRRSASLGCEVAPR